MSSHFSDHSLSPAGLESIVKVFLLFCPPSVPHHSGFVHLISTLSLQGCFFSMEDVAPTINEGIFYCYKKTKTETTAI